MNETERILLLHAGRYPLMEPQDAVKLLYQAAFGGGHLIADPDAARRRLLEEYAAVEQSPTAPLQEEIGGGLARIYLPALDAHGLTPERLFDWFYASAGAIHADHDSLPAKLETLRRLTEAGRFSFSGPELDAYLSAYAAAGFPPVSHSERYRRAYRPAYRVVLKNCPAGFSTDA